MLVLCDFDGTITQQDVTNGLLDKFSGPAWREEVLPRYRAGQINHTEVMQLSYAYLKTALPELEAEFPNFVLRPHFNRLVSFCREQGYPLSVVSGGLDFYIKAFLPSDLPFYSYLGQYDEAAQIWRVTLPDWPTVNLAEGQDFKVRVLEELRKQHPADFPAVFIGDGRNDGPVAAQAELVFAVQGSPLVRICRDRGQDCFEFADFAQIVARLQDLKN